MLRKTSAVLLTIIAVLATAWLALRRPDIPYSDLEQRYAYPESQFLMSEDGTRLHYRDTGPRDGQALLLVHGFSGSLHTWQDWQDRLDDSYRVISIDLPGHGLSRVSDPKAVDNAYLAGVVQEVAERLDLERFTLAGHSMGGAAAWEYAVRHDDRLEGLILVAASGWPPETETQRPLLLRLMANPMARRVLKDLDLSSLIASAMESFYADQSLITEELVERYSALSRAPGHRETLLHLLAIREARQTATDEALSAITVPTLIIAGKEDQVVALSGASRFQAAIEGSELVLLNGVGHMPQEEAPAVTAERVSRFLTDVGIAGEQLAVRQEGRVQQLRMAPQADGG